MEAGVRIARFYLAVAAVCACVGLHAAQGTFARISVIRVYRAAEYLAPPAADWKPARAGAPLKAEDSLRTSNNSYVDMEFDPPNRFRLKENSLLKIERLYEESKEAGGSVVRLTDLGLLRGEVIARLDKLPAEVRLSLRSPAAIAAVRGTGFLIDVGSDGMTTGVAVSNGIVSVQAEGEPGKRVNVGADQETTVSPWGAALLRAKGTGLPPKEMLLKRLGDPKVPFEDAKSLLERLKSPRPSLGNLVLAVRGEAVAPPEMEARAEAERWAREEAARRARVQILEKMKMILLSGDETMGDLMGKDETVRRKILSEIAGATVSKSEYDERERLAVVRVELPMERIRRAVGRDILLAWKEITPIGMTEYAAAFGGLIRATTERAATVDAYRRLAEKIYGTVVTSTTTLRDFVIKDDRIEIAVKGVVKGAEEVSKTYYSDGSIDVVLEVRGSAVRAGIAPVAGDILGEHYMASPTVIDAQEFVDLLALKEL